MKYTQWNAAAFDQAAAERLHAAGHPRLLSAVMAARGVEAPGEAGALLVRERHLQNSPFLMKDMDKAVRRIRLALERGERMAVFGDYDVDGITSTVLLVHYLRSQGADCIKHIPRRIEDGYGLGRDALRALRDQGVTLVVTVDCGITGVEEARFAREIGLDLVITDHHECKEVLPEAVAVVDPRRSDCPYPFKHLAGVGVALKLVLALGEPQAEALFQRYSALAAIGTVADVMLMTGENRTIVSRTWPGRCAPSTGNGRPWSRRSTPRPSSRSRASPPPGETPWSSPARSGIRGWWASWPAASARDTPAPAS